MPPPLIGTVEESKAKRLERHRSRFRERGGVFIPNEKNALLEILLARGVNGESPRKSQSSGQSSRKAPRKSVASSSSSKTAKKPKAPRKSVKEPVTAIEEDGDFQPMKRSKSKGKGKLKAVEDDLVEEPSEPLRSNKSKSSKPSNASREKAVDITTDEAAPPSRKKPTVKASRGKGKTNATVLDGEEPSKSTRPKPSSSKSKNTSSTSVNVLPEGPSALPPKPASSRTAPPSKAESSSKRKLPSTTSSKPTSSTSTFVSSHNSASISTARTTPDPSPVADTKPPRRKLSTRPPAEWELSTIMESGEEDEEDDIPLAQVLTAVPSKHSVPQPPPTEPAKVKKRAQNAEEELEKPAPNKKRKVKPAVDADDEPAPPSKRPSKKRVQAASMDDGEVSVPERKLAKTHDGDDAAGRTDDAPVKRKRARVEDDEPIAKNDPPPKKRARKPIEENTSTSKRSRAKASGPDLKVEVDDDCVPPTQSRHGKENHNVVSRIAKEAAKAPSIRPIPSPVKPTLATDKLASKVLKPQIAAPRTTKPRSKKAPQSQRSKPVSRGPPPDVLKRVEANARMRRAAEDEDDEIDFLS